MPQGGSSTKVTSLVSFFFNWNQVQDIDYLEQLPQNNVLAPTLRFSYFTYRVLGEIKNLTRHRPEQCALVKSAFGMRVWTRQAFKDLFQLDDCVTL